MTVAFPPICPQKRSINAGKYPVKRFSSYSGASLTRLYGTKPFDSDMKLEYLLPDAEVAVLVKCYHDSKSGYEDLSLPAAVYGGIGSELLSQLKTYTWRWQGPPKIESVRPGLSRIDVSLIGTLEI